MEYTDAAKEEIPCQIGCYGLRVQNLGGDCGVFRWVVSCSCFFGGGFWGKTEFDGDLRCDSARIS